MSNGYTPAPCAAEYGKCDMLKWLLQHNADISMIGRYGHIARIYGHSHCVALTKDSLEIQKSKYPDSSLN